MTRNQETAEWYMDAFAQLDHEIENDAFTGKPLIPVDRVIDEGMPVPAAQSETRYAGETA